MCLTWPALFAALGDSAVAPRRRELYREASPLSRAVICYSEASSWRPWACCSVRRCMRSATAARGSPAVIAALPPPRHVGLAALQRHGLSRLVRALPRVTSRRRPWAREPSSKPERYRRPRRTHGWRYEAGRSSTAGAVVRLASFRDRSSCTLSLKPKPSIPDDCRPRSLAAAPRSRIDTHTHRRYPWRAGTRAT